MFIKGMYDKRISWKAKGLLLFVLLNNDDDRNNILGFDHLKDELTYLGKDNKKSIESSLKELETWGYLQTYFPINESLHINYKFHPISQTKDFTMTGVLHKCGADYCKGLYVVNSNEMYNADYSTLTTMEDKFFKTVHEAKVECLKSGIQLDVNNWKD